MKPPYTLPSLTELVAVVDYETYYDDEYSVSKMSYWHYCHHAKFRAYRVGIVTNDGFQWKGDPKDAPWDQIKNHVWVSHNRPFDWSVHTSLQEKGIVPAWHPPYWGNSANLCAWIRVPRSLAKAVAELYRVIHKKDIRDKDMKGKSWEEYGAELQARVDKYVIDDCSLTLRIWMDNIASWPIEEIRISDLIDNRGLRGLRADRKGMDEDIAVLERAVHSALVRIPWHSDPDEKPLSMAACTKECRKHGIRVPESLSMADADLQVWEDEFGERFPFVGAMRDYRRMNSILKKYQTIYDRIKGDGRFEFSVSYLGTHTGRTSGTDKGGDRGGANLLNMPRDPFYLRSDLSVVHRKKELKEIAAYRKANAGALPPGIEYLIDLRSKIIPEDGHVFVIADAAQIEARITNWMAGDKKTLALIREGISVYDAHAIALMGIKPKFDANGKPISLKKSDPQKYALAKARELALGFQAGHQKFIEMARLYIDDEDFDSIFDKEFSDDDKATYEGYLEATKQIPALKTFQALDLKGQRIRIEAWKQVEQFREAKKHTLVKLWRSLQEDLNNSATTKGNCHTVELPDGRVLTYFAPQIREGNIVAQVERGGPFKYFYGGKILENAVQAFARQIFCTFQLAMDDLGIPVVLDVYDEVVCELPVGFDQKVIERIMSTTPRWAPGLPLAAETEIASHYKK